MELRWKCQAAFLMTWKVLATLEPFNAPPPTAQLFLGLEALGEPLRWCRSLGTIVEQCMCSGLSHNAGLHIDLHHKDHISLQASLVWLAYVWLNHWSQTRSEA